ncbi:hypothetical protein SLE2022_040900 [Rubroshorea leprosula]
MQNHLRPTDYRLLVLDLGMNIKALFFLFITNILICILSGLYHLSMAPTAAMLILISHRNKPSPVSSSSSPPSVSAVAASLEMKVSEMKMFLRRRYGCQTKEPTMGTDSLSSADSALEKRFREALELGCC